MIVATAYLYISTTVFLLGTQRDAITDNPPARSGGSKPAEPRVDLVCE
ncbi:MAG: hypothetical protein M3022_11810 [Actinomycetota bacterium]|nr:hypothetical protein [Actinomycetota bacterium]